MGEPREVPPCWFLVGPTASGKNSGAIPIARALGAEILVLDSMKVFRGMDVGTAKPTAEMRAAVPHHALDLVDPSEPFDIARYLRAVDLALADLDSRGVSALFVGGTHLYLGALLRGVWVGPPPDHVLRAELEARAAAGESLHERLAAVDPASASRLHPNDRRRIIRALEVHAVTGQALSVWQRDHTRPHLRRGYRGLMVVRPREELYERIDRRIPAMFDAGWVDEVEAIRSGSGFGPQARHAIGYQEIDAALAAGEDPRGLVPAIAGRTHDFARKQLNWLARFDQLDQVSLAGQSGASARDALLRAIDARRAAPPSEPAGGVWLRT